MSDKHFFADWWKTTGQRMRPAIRDTYYTFAKRCAEQSWLAAKTEYLGRIAELKAQITALIQDHRDAFAPDQPGHDLHEFLNELERLIRD